jgi:hypothetical protein
MEQDQMKGPMRRVGRVGRLVLLPNGRPGYIIDHVIPLACHGADDPSNMPWQTVAEAKAKDETERAGCSDVDARARAWARVEPVESTEIQ